VTTPVLVSQAGDITTLTLNQPDSLNAFSEDLVDALTRALDKLETNPPRLVVFRANGKGFSGGMDLSGLDAATDGDILLRLVRIEQLLQRVRHATFATTALVHGPCYGAAADLVLACRQRVASADAKFLMPGLRFGIVLGTRRLRDTIGEVNAYQLLDRIKPFNAEEACETGFITQLAEVENWTDVVNNAHRNLAGFSNIAYANRTNSLTPDTRASDMQALVTSIAEGSVKQRMLDYVSEVKAEREKHKR